MFWSHHEAHIKNPVISTVPQFTQVSRLDDAELLWVRRSALDAGRIGEGKLVRIRSSQPAPARLDDTGVDELEAITESFRACSFPPTAWLLVGTAVRRRAQACGLTGHATMTR